MSARQILKNNLNWLMSLKGWTSNLQVVAASSERLSNGTLGRVRSESGENVRLNVIEELAEVFGRAPHELLDPALSAGKPGADSSRPAGARRPIDFETLAMQRLDELGGAAAKAVVRAFLIETALARDRIEAERVEAVRNLTHPKV